MAKNNCTSEVRIVFEKLALFREESHRQIFDIINSHNNSVNKGTNDLVSEVTDLQDELSVIKKEQHGLLEIIDNLNGEIRQLNEKLAMAHSFKEPEDNFEHHTQGNKDSPIEVEQDLESLGTLIETDTEEVIQVIDDTFHTHLKARNTYLSIDHNNFSESPILHRELTKVGLKQIKQMQAHNDLIQVEAGRSVVKEKCTREKTQRDFVCPVCSFSFSTNENLGIHCKNRHSNLDMHVIVFEELKKKLQHTETNCSDLKIEKKSSHSRVEKFKCNQCP